MTPAFQNIILGNPTINYGGTSTTQNVAQQLVIQTNQDLHKVLLYQGDNTQSLSELDELLDKEEDSKEAKESKAKEWAKKAFSWAAEQVKDFAAKAVAQYLDVQTRRITG